MPVRLIDHADRPTYVSKPDIRFATTFLSHEYRDYSVEGEALMDKMTGELFIKRPVDGRVLSFEQNKKYAYDQVLELRILLTNNEDFTYPGKNNNAYYVSTNYDLVTINKDVPNDILVSNNTEIASEGASGVDLRNTLSFNISGECNGFFITPTTRDADKTIVRILSNLYDEYICNYDGSDPAIKAEQRKFQTIEKWKDSDIILSYKISITLDGSTTTYDATDYIRFNEGCCVLFPKNITERYPYGYDSAKVIITKLDYYKMHFVQTLSSDITGLDDDTTVLESVSEYLCPDGKVYCQWANIVSFVDTYKDLRLLGNEVTVGFLDIPYIRRYMTKMAKLKRASEFIQSSARPNDEEWGANAVWAEMVRTIGLKGEVVNHNSESDLKELEMIISKNNFGYVDINTDITVKKDIYLEEGEIIDVPDDTSEDPDDTEQNPSSETNTNDGGE